MVRLGFARQPLNRYCRDTCILQASVPVIPSPSVPHRAPYFGCTLRRDRIGMIAMGHHAKLAMRSIFKFKTLTNSAAVFGNNVEPTASGRRSLSHTFSHGLSHRLSHMTYSSSGPIVPPAPAPRNSLISIAPSATAITESPPSPVTRGLQLEELRITARL
jgi:hypothetical protein